MLRLSYYWRWLSAPEFSHARCSVTAAWINCPGVGFHAFPFYASASFSFARGFSLLFLSFLACIFFFYVFISVCPFCFITWLCPRQPPVLLCTAYEVFNDHDADGELPPPRGLYDNFKPSSDR